MFMFMPSFSPAVVKKSIRAWMGDQSELQYHLSSMKACPVLVRSVQGGEEGGVEEEGIEIQKKK